jgi:hypothetical protein
VLEDRVYPANIAVTGHTLLDPQLNLILAPPVGGMAFVRVDWTTTDLLAGQSYFVRYWVNDIPLESSTLGVLGGDHGLDELANTQEFEHKLDFGPQGA